jgi:hypothetical protein
VDEPSSVREQTAHFSMAATSVDTGGYVHLYSNSKFRLGTLTSNQSALGFEKVIGSEGVFVTFPHSGWVFGSPNGRSPALQAQPFAGTAAAHAQAVLGYFVAVGLPSSQVMRVDTGYGGEATAQEGVPETTKTTFTGYVSSVQRVVGGIPVAESHAAACINGDGDVVEEDVYWPALPQNIVADAHALQKTLADPSLGPALRGSLPAGFVPGQVTIHHSPAAYGGSFEAIASYDMDQPAPMARTHHYDIRGSEIVMAHERQPNLVSNARHALKH